RRLRQAEADRQLPVGGDRAVEAGRVDHRVGARGGEELGARAGAMAGAEIAVAEAERDRSLGEAEMGVARAGALLRARGRREQQNDCERADHFQPPPTPGASNLPLPSRSKTNGLVKANGKPPGTTCAKWNSGLLSS